MANSSTEALAAQHQWQTELRLSRSGYSLKCGERIVARCTMKPGDFDPGGERFSRWLADADKLIDGWNAINRIPHIEFSIRGLTHFDPEKFKEFMEQRKIDIAKHCGDLT